MEIGPEDPAASDVGIQPDPRTLAGLLLDPEGLDVVIAS
jgi:hypothetical protein